MSPSLTKEHPISYAEDSDNYDQFHRAIKAAAAGAPIGLGSDDDIDDDRSLRVLIVDDYRAAADTLSSLVAIWGHDVRCAYDGATGLALAAAYRPDVLLLDILMDNVSGIDVAMQVRRQERLEHCFIVAITGRTDAKHRNRCYEAGVDLLLTKPVTPSHMQTLLMLESDHVRQSRGNSAVSADRRELAVTR